MVERDITPSRGRRRVVRLVAAGLALSVAPFLVIYGWLALATLLQGSHPAAWGAYAYTPYGLLAQGVFARPVAYLALSVSGLALALVILWLPGQRRRVRGWAIFAVALIALLPAAWRYQPALGAAPGLRAIVATRPLLGVVKSAQVAAEMRPCSYALLGWQGGQLYYRAMCTAGSVLMAWAPESADAPTRVDTLPRAWDHLTIPEHEALALVRAAGVRPVTHEAVTRPLLLAGDALASADGRCTALVSQHLYGPQDVLVLVAAQR
jgi:hypothetical protein